MKPTAERVRELLDYDRVTGAFTWRVERRGSARAGSPAGSVTTSGYLRIRIDGGCSFMAHRLAWLYVTGEWPSEEIDHADGVKINNAFQNLRDVPKSLNQQNRIAARSDSGTGVQGVQQAASGRYKANIQIDGRQVHLGTFESMQAAMDARVAAKKKHHEVLR